MDKIEYEWKESCRQQRLSEQEMKQDYQIDNDGNYEMCGCGRYLNSHSHCPNCDYKSNQEGE